MHERSIEIIKQLAHDRGVPFSETTYWGRTPEEVCRLHRTGLARLGLAAGRDGTALLIYHDEYEIMPEPLDQDAEGPWHLLDEDEDAGIAGANPSVVLVDRPFSLDQWRGIDFHDGARTILSVDAGEFRRAVGARACEFSRRAVPPRYRARLARFVPVSAAPGLKYQRGCVLGISLDNENFDRDERLSATLEWISEDFDHCLVIVGDSIHRLTLRIRDPDLDEADALERAIATGRRFQETKRHLFEEHRRRCRFTPLPMSDPACQAMHQDRVDQLRAFYEESAAYRRVVDAFAGQFVDRQSPAAPTTVRRRAEEARRLACAYLLEEAAFCGLMVELGASPVLVYPGDIKPFQAVSNGEIPDAPEALRKLQLVSLEIERQWLPGEKPSRCEGTKAKAGNGRLLVAAR